MFSPRSLILTLLVASLVGAAPAAAGFTPGSAGLGDPYYPREGNGGYDVAHYDLAIDWTPSTNQMVATTVITATATQDLSRFNLDLRGFTVSQVLVNGAAATHARSPQELVITPASGIPKGTTFTVEIDYAGKPSVVRDAGGMLGGWIPTNDGAFVAGEPLGSSAWFPVNNTPRDKARYDFAITVPDGRTAMANGVLVSHASTAGKTTWVWHASDLTAPYLVTATVGFFDLNVSHVGSIPSYIAVDPVYTDRRVLRSLPAMVKYYAKIFGRYPFDSVGAIVDRAPNVGYALETQTKPVFSRMPHRWILAHELAHMWFGDSVTLRRWPDIWLHEGFATWSEWIWSEHTGRGPRTRSSGAITRRPRGTSGSGDRRPEDPAGRRACSTGRSTCAAG